VIVDSHNDLLMRVMAGDKVEARSSKGNSDLVRFTEARYAGQFFSVWVDPIREEHGESYNYANRMIDSLDAILRRNPARIVKAANGAEFDAAQRSGKLAAMIGIEGGHAIESSIDKLIRLYRRGARYLGLTWNNSVPWASSARDESGRMVAHPGLSAFGRQVIRTMDSLGMLVDVSHSGEKTFWDVIATTKNPIIASHSSVYRLCPHFRNLKDEQITAIARTGGVVMINFFPKFIDSAFTAKKEKALAEYGKKLAFIEKKYAGNPPLLRETKARFFSQKEVRALPGVHTVADHIDYVKKLAGIDHVGIGADFDGIDIAPLGLEDVTRLSNLTDELCRRGYSEEEIRKVLGGNILRVFRKVCR
jgi:membrane dipeptidase